MYIGYRPGRKGTDNRTSVPMSKRWDIRRVNNEVWAVRHIYLAMIILYIIQEGLSNVVNIELDYRCDGPDETICKRVADLNENSNWK